jgi:plasmid stabilization system protein ParE
MAVRLNRQVKAELDDIWLYIAVENSSLEIADRVVETITGTFLQLSKYPNLGRRRDDIRKRPAEYQCRQLRCNFPCGGK